MPGASMPCLAQWIPIVGCDWHLEIPPFPPAPIPHIVVWLINGLGLDINNKMANTVHSPLGKLVCRNYDAAFVVGHIPLGGFALLPVAVFGSTNKCEFGASSLQLDHRGPAAIGVAYVVGLQLQCNQWCALPTGVSLSILNCSVRAGFTWADLVGSLCGMAFDVAVGWALGKLYGLAGKWLANVVGQIFIAINPNVAAGLIFAIVGYGKSPTSSNPSAMEYIFSTGVGILGGSPLGYNAGKDQSVLWDRTLGPGGWMDRTFGVHAPSGDDAFNFGRGLFGD